MANFFPVPSVEIEQFLQSKGFTRTIHGREVVYTIRHHINPDVVVKVYTSIRDGQSEVRTAGKDAIRTCVVFESRSRSFGIGRFAPVFRVTSTESTLSRLLSRMREAYAHANEWVKNGKARSAATA